MISNETDKLVMNYRIYIVHELISNIDRAARHSSSYGNISKSNCRRIKHSHLELVKTILIESMNSVDVISSPTYVSEQFNIYG